MEEQKGFQDVDWAEFGAVADGGVPLRVNCIGETSLMAEEDAEVF